MIAEHKEKCSRSRFASGVVLALALAFTISGQLPVCAQPPDQRSGDGDGDRGRRGRGRGGFDLRNVDPEQVQRFRRMMRERYGGGPPGNGNNDEDNQDDEDEGDESDDNRKEENDQRDSSIERSTLPPRVPDPRELEVKLDDRGRVPPFAFVGQSWPDVLQWLANLYSFSLDWQEMPSDYLNLVAEDSLTVDEVRDLINRHLLARGFTTLIEKEVLSVFRISDVEPSLVKRVSEDELYDLKPYELVKVSFQLPNGLEPDRAAEDVQKILSPNARVFPLNSTKRLLVLDVVANLRNISALFNEERNIAAMPREFVLRYARGEKVIETLYVLLGINPEQQPQQMDMRAQRQRWEAIEEIAERGGDVQRMIDGGPKVYLAYNSQRNSILANAPPEHMRVIAQTIRSMDVPPGGYDLANDGSLNRAGGAPDYDERYLEKYQLVTTDPDRMLVTLEEVGGLSPWAEMRTDPSSKTLFVRGSKGDQEKVARIVEQLDGAGRQFHVISLRQLPADSVAGTIQQMLVRSSTNSEEEDDNRGRRSRWRRLFDNSDDEYDPTEGFRVSADIEANRLLLWANATELKLVNDLLEQLGESGRAIAPSGMKVIDVKRESVDQIIDELRKAWAGQNELIIEDDEDDGNNEPEDSPSTQDDRDESQEVPRAELSARNNHGTPRVFLAQNTQELDQERPADDRATDEESAESPPSPSDQEPEQEPEDRDEPPAAAPPVKITKTQDGRIVVSSDDPDAVVRIENLIRALGPRESPFDVFPIRHVTASSVWMQLTDYFAEDLSGGGSDSQYQGLSNRRALQILYDYDSQVILVANASESQLYEIEELINVLDRPRNRQAMQTRRTAIIPLRYSQATVVAATLKDVYRDLLSTRDRTFESNDDRGRNSMRTINEDTVIQYGLSPGNQSTNSDPIQVGFDGALSVGVDEMSNAVVISAEQSLFAPVVSMIRELDEQAVSDTQIAVHRIGDSINSEALQSALRTILETSDSENNERSNNRSNRRRNRNRRSSVPDDRRFGFQQIDPGEIDSAQLNRELLEREQFQIRGSQNGSSRRGTERGGRRQGRGADGGGRGADGGGRE